MAAVTDYELAHGYETVNYYRSGGAAKIELNRPERLNAWNEQFSIDLLAALKAATDDPEVRAVLITGAGRGFSSGADLGGDPEHGSGEAIYERLTKRYHPIMVSIRQMPKPVVSAVHGPAAGIGVSLALICDLVTAAESAYFLLAFVNIGLVPDGGSSLFVPARVGFARAAEMAMLGEPVTAPKAADIGLINASWPDEDFEQNAEALLLRLSNGPTRSYAGTKRELNHWVYSRMAEHLALEASIQGELAKSKDFAEGIAAFLEKRPTQFTGE
jgi:2-(1,2-epoxy-1,2-dihydrophenyl)acetyl-CoA isomerase